MKSLKFPHMSSMIKKIHPLLISLIFIAGTAAAGDSAIKTMTVINTRDHLLLYLNIENAFSEKTIEAVNRGIPASFEILSDISRVRNLWFDKNISSLKNTHTIKYDILKKHYTVTRSWVEPEYVTADTFDEAVNLMTRIESLQIINLNTIKKGVHYRIKAKARLESLSLPGFRKYLLFFLPYSEFETDWGFVDFTL